MTMQRYELKNTVLDIKVTSPLVKNMDEAKDFFDNNFPLLKLCGSNMVQIEGINEAHGANFSCHWIWVSKEESQAFYEAYGVPIPSRYIVGHKDCYIKSFDDLY